MEEVRAGEHPLLRETRGSHPTIAALARSCLDAFQKCLNKAVDVHPREVTLVENQIARFSVWTANIGVFASGRGSLDHRLREAPDVQDTVGGLLEALELQAQRCLEVLDSLSPKVSEKSSEQMDLSLDQILTEIAGEISLLHKFSNTIRRASKEVHKQKAAKLFQIRDDEGNDVEDFLEQLFVHHIRDQFPEVSESIQQRLAKTMLLRRKRILYRRSRYGSKPTRTQAQPAQPVASKAAVRVKKEQNQPHEVGQETVAAQGKAPADDTARSAVRSTAMTATTLAPDHFKKSSTPSVVSMSKTVALSSHDNLRFPPAPCGGLLRKYNKLKARSKSARPIVIDHTAEEAGESGRITFDTSVDRAEVTNNEILRKEWDEYVAAVGEIICPFCFCALPVAEVVNDKRWKEHVKGDLDPYVCLFEDCDCGEELYTHSNSWLKHMRDHTLKWKCKSKLHPLFEASSKQDYLDHMRAVHSGKFNDAQLGVLADKNARAAGQLFRTCPLCGEADVNGSMEDHVVGHMRFLALKSLPSYEEDTGAHSDLGGSQDDEFSATAHSRSTLKHDANTKSTSFGDSRNTHELHDPDDFITPGQASQKFAASELHSSHLLAEAHGILTDPTYEQLFSEIPLGERQQFEWGFISNKYDSSNTLEHDPGLEVFRQHHVPKRGDEPGAPVMFQKTELRLGTGEENKSRIQTQSFRPAAPRPEEAKIQDDTKKVNIDPSAAGGDLMERGRHDENRQPFMSTHVATSSQADNAHSLAQKTSEEYPRTQNKLASNSTKIWNTVRPLQFPRQRRSFSSSPVPPPGWVPETVSAYCLRWTRLQRWLATRFGEELATFDAGQSMRDDRFFFYCPDKLSRSDRAEIDRLRG